nr:unnamed protein product [Digitaria exilis]
MEPIAFFTTASGLLVVYAYFLITSRDPTYQDFMERLFLSRQRKLYAAQKFDLERSTVGVPWKAITLTIPSFMACDATGTEVSPLLSEASQCTL